MVSFLIQWISISIDFDRYVDLSSLDLIWGGLGEPKVDFLDTFSLFLEGLVWGSVFVWIFRDSVPLEPRKTAIFLSKNKVFCKIDVLDAGSKKG